MINLHSIDNSHNDENLKNKDIYGATQQQQKQSLKWNIKKMFDHFRVNIINCHTIHKIKTSYSSLSLLSVGIWFSRSRFPYFFDAL